MGDTPDPAAAAGEGRDPGSPAIIPDVPLADGGKEQQQPEGADGAEPEKGEEDAGDAEGEADEGEPEDRPVRAMAHVFSLQKVEGEKLGLTLADSEGAACFVETVAEESVAQRAGMLPGMEVVEVCGKAVKLSKEAEVAIQEAKADPDTETVQIKCQWEEYADDEFIEPFLVGMQAEVLRSTGKWTPCVVKGIDERNECYTVSWVFQGEEQLKQVSFDHADRGALRHRILYTKGQTIEVLRSSGQYSECVIDDIDVQRQCYVIRITAENEGAPVREVDFALAARGQLRGTPTAPGALKGRKKGEAPDGKPAGQKAEDEDDIGPWWWVMIAGAVIIVVLAAVIIAYSDGEPQVPHHLHITVDENDTDAQVMGLYTLVPDEQPNGRPCWHNEERGTWLFSSPNGLWTISTGKEHWETGAGYIASEHRHMGLMPHQMRPRAEARGGNSTGWQHASNNTWKKYSNIHIDAPHTFSIEEEIEWNSPEYGWRKGRVSNTSLAPHGHNGTNVTVFAITDGEHGHWNLSSWPGSHVRRLRALNNTAPQEVPPPPQYARRANQGEVRRTTRRPVRQADSQPARQGEVMTEADRPREQPAEDEPDQLPSGEAEERPAVDLPQGAEAEDEGDSMG
eukprot:TRINITY_DN70327_c0_g1_i1.p1 TRINITY_DN70327_c0_g1~~TRINITY_DN70327_c0_g1_i1.p1  ORF type:complete len:658 (+),score=199.62 TRINITY_DN70327_c0_g1_i1:104-1975(+)